ncbi:hypothetical protein WBG78_10560 [Chryseolinea sp. T2]|uniref:hypothetical protein n=1 Tax=Chryseolinea sp. T2 TaxID=3129255 RepID=UPI00307702DE
MSKKLIILALGLTWSLQSFGQVERQAIENIWKGKWEKAFYQLDRAGNKDTIRVTSAYAWALYFGAVDNPDYSLDSASRYIRASVDLYGQTTEKQRERLRRFPIDSIVLVAERNSIDSAALVKTREDGSASAYQQFLDIHPGSIYQADAIASRDERAFQDAVNTNTHQAFYQYLDRYPQSSRTSDARANYERLLYHDYTNGKDLAGYERFLRDHPGTSFEKEAHRNIFEIRTADGSRDAYLNYLKAQSPYSRRATDVLYHLEAGAPADNLPSSAWNDSLRAAASIHPAYITPILVNGRYGFIDPGGQTILEPTIESIPEDYLCGNITDNVIQLDSSVIALNGKVIYYGKVDEMEDLGQGLLLISMDGCQRIIHKSGWLVISDCVDQAKIIADRFIAVQQQSKWRLLTLTGRPVMKRAWDAVSSVHQMIVLESEGEKFVSTPAKLSIYVAEPAGVDPFVRFDRIQRWTAGITSVRLGNEELLLDVNSDTLVHSPGGTLLPARFGVVVVENDTNSHTVNWRRESSEAFRSVRVSGSRAIVQTSQGWRMFDPVHRQYLSAAFDSLWWTGPFAVGTRRDSVNIFFSSGPTQKFKGKLQATSVLGPDSTSYLLIDMGQPKPKRLYAQNGKSIMQVPYEKIQALGQGYFRVFKGGKVGLVSSDGKLIVPTTMDAIGTINNQSVSLLKDGRFGLFHCLTRKVIQPQFPTNLTPYGRQYVVVQKNGQSGLYKWDSKPASKFEYDEVKYWNDTAAFVRKDSWWSLVSLQTNKVLIDSVRGIRFIRQHTDDQLAIVNTGDSFGVLHSRKGTVIPLTFTDIVNIGSAEWPLFFTEKHIPEASLYVVIYYDRDGRFLRKESYNPDEYERIYCPNN